MYESFCQNHDVLPMERTISKKGSNKNQERYQQDNFYPKEFGKKHREDRDFKRLEWRINKTKEELLAIANELLATNKDSNAAKFILRTYDKVTLFAELTTRDIIIHDNNNHIENLMGIVGQKVKKNHQSWVDNNLNIMLKIIWYIIS
jgi:hypothetical protein